MPLKKSGSSAAVVEPPTQAAAPATPAPTGVDTGRMQGKEPNAANIPKAAPKQSAPKGAKLDKEEYWTRKEERDIETGKRIRRSGVWQAALESMSGLQFNQGGTLETYLDLVDKIADRGLTYVNKD